MNIGILICEEERSSTEYRQNSIPEKDSCKKIEGYTIYITTRRDKWVHRAFNRLWLFPSGYFLEKQATGFTFQPALAVE